MSLAYPATAIALCFTSTKTATTKGAATGAIAKTSKVAAAKPSTKATMGMRCGDA